MSFVTKRNGTSEPVQFDKITERIHRLINPIELQGLPWLHVEKETEYLDPILVVQKVIANLYSGITTEELDIESAEICVNLSTTHPSYAYLGGRILISNLHKKTMPTFSDKMVVLADHGIINKTWLQWVITHRETLDAMINYNLDYTYDYFGFKTLEKSYLLKVNGVIIERPQDMLLRTAVTLQMGNLVRIEQTYRNMANGYYTHASPTLFNAGTNHMQLSSCFLLGTSDDLSSIAHTWDSCAQISKWSGGIGLHVSNIRGKDSRIHGTNGQSSGLVPFLKVFNDIARWIDQGGKRPGSIAIYLEPHHPDILSFLELRKNFGTESERARDLFQALWISDAFMKQVEVDGDWYLLSSDECPGLTDTYGEAFDTLYWSYVHANKYRTKLSARKVWLAILEAQIETGMPYVLYKDAINKKSNQQNIGIIRSSNLCAEIIQYSDDKEYAVCNLASIALKPFVRLYDPEQCKGMILYSKPNCVYCDYAKNYLKTMGVAYTEIPFSKESVAELKSILTTPITFPQLFLPSSEPSGKIAIGGWHELYKWTAGTFDYDQLYEVAYMATINLNRVIDINFYPVPETRRSNMKHRPIGLGIQGLADALVLLRIPFDSEEALAFNARIMETIYLAACTASNDMAKERHEEMTELIALLKGKESICPEYYDEHYQSSDERISVLYHQLKPTIHEIKDTITPGAYSSFQGSPFSKGIFQFDQWNTTPLSKEKWEALRTSVMTYGMRNSMLTALMPTASTSQILANNECFEFFTNNIYSRKTQAGSFVQVNKYLVNDLIHVGVWSKEIKDRIIAMNGSIQTLEEIPPELRTIYKTMWEIKQIWVLKGALARGPYVDQTQSMNIFMGEPDYQRLASSHFWAWKNGLKTGMYYLRTKPATDAIKFTIDPQLIKKMKEENMTCETCSA